MMRKIYQFGYIITILCTIGIIITLITGMKMKESYESPDIVNLMRVKVNSEYTLIQDNWPLTNEVKEELETELKQKGVSIAVTNLEGTVIYDYKSLFESGTKVDLREHLYYDQSFKVQNKDEYLIGFPIYSEERVVGFAIFNVSLSGMLEENKMPVQWFLLITILGVLWLCSAIITVVAYYKKQSYNHFEEVINGLEHVTKGIYKPLKLPKETNLQPIYVSYNRMVEELAYLMKKQQSDENKRKSFLTTIGHELKTPIAAINAYIEGLVSGVAKDQETVENYQRIIQDKMQRLMRQVDDLFKYAQDDMDKFKYHFKEVYADDVFNKIIGPLTAKEHKRNLIVQNHIPKCMINVDSMRIEQVVLNLYNNSIKHTPVDGKLMIQAYRQENEILFSLEDNGEGIDPTDLPHIFDYYYQGNTSKKQDYEGVGLGLAICKEIIEKHGGNIYVKSQLGRGTKISFTIPIV